MPGLQGENAVAALGSPIRRSKLSLKFLQKKETKRALCFSEPQADEPKIDELVEPEARSVLFICDLFGVIHFLVLAQVCDRLACCAASHSLTLRSVF